MGCSRKVAVVDLLDQGCADTVLCVSSVGTGKNHTTEDHMFDVREPSSGDPMTDDEWANLESEGFNLNESDPKLRYGIPDLLKA
jgi:hypothetical protein